MGGGESYVLQKICNTLQNLFDKILWYIKFLKVVSESNKSLDWGLFLFKTVESNAIKYSKQRTPVHGIISWLRSCLQHECYTASPDGASEKNTPTLKHFNFTCTISKSDQYQKALTDPGAFILIGESRSYLSFNQKGLLWTELSKCGEKSSLHLETPPMSSYHGF